MYANFDAEKFANAFNGEMNICISSLRMDQPRPLHAMGHNTTQPHTPRAHHLQLSISPQLFIGAFCPLTKSYFREIRSQKIIDFFFDVYERLNSIFLYILFY